MTDSIAIRVGDIVTRTGNPRPWRVVDVYPDLGFARLEFAAEAWVRSATDRLENLTIRNSWAPGTGTLIAVC
jgi:hypothetical protein